MQKTGKKISCPSMADWPIMTEGGRYEYLLSKYPCDISRALSSSIFPARLAVFSRLDMGPVAVRRTEVRDPDRSDVLVY